MTLPKIIIHSDVFIDFLLCPRGESSLLRRVMGAFFCYTTVFHAIQLFSLARTEMGRAELEYAMSAMKILGLNAKSAKQYGDLLSRCGNMAAFDLLIAGVCLETKLPLLTGRTRDFRSVPGLTVIPTGSFSHTVDARGMVDVYHRVCAETKTNSVRKSL